MEEFNPNEHQCPFCLTEYPDWKKHDTYARYLISFMNGCIITDPIDITTFKCQSCIHTHALLPEFIIPYQAYSFIFILLVMRDYFMGRHTINSLCDKYGICVSSFYCWKKLFLKHKKLWLGLLEDAVKSSLEFIKSFFTGNRLHILRAFFETAGISFLQGRTCTKNAYCTLV